MQSNQRIYILLIDLILTKLGPKFNDVYNRWVARTIEVNNLCNSKLKKGNNFDELPSSTFLICFYLTLVCNFRFNVYSVQGIIQCSCCSLLLLLLLPILKMRSIGCCLVAWQWCWHLLTVAVRIHGDEKRRR